MSDISTVYFDLDGTLCVSNQSTSEIHQELFERMGIEPIFTPSDLRAVDSADVDSADSGAEFYTNLYRETIATLSTAPDVDSALLTELGEITAEIVDATDVSVRPGARDALEYASQHYDVGLITNGSQQTQTAKLETLKIADLFDVAVFCDPAQGVEPKPATEPFRRALTELSTSPEEAIYVGNDHSTDVVGAHTAGMQSVWVPRIRPDESIPSTPDPAPTFRLDSPSELPTVL